ncbi:Scarecrow-like protein 32 [Apostasia shenzhenica]|uniref:Scarecrow-like protein 32 n=1 Tax=Apostasia shenzhenica TaxID=1088818 RepID=A0A2I0AWG4_9ASPA|nr:Scarecrow-like protein 32 [Apostasia shenzhenica]
MMQFTESAAASPFSGSESPPAGLLLNLNGGPNSHAGDWPWPHYPASGKTSLGRYNSGAFMEQLLLHCAYAIEANDATLAQQILWVLHNIAPPDGDPNQRLTAAFVRALILRASRSGSPCGSLASTVAAQDAPLCLPAVALAGFVDLTPWHRFGFTAANAAIADATDSFPVIHIVDLTTTYSMQIPTLIDSLACRPDGPRFIRLTVISPSPANSPPPTLETSFDDLGSRLVNFARSRNVGMEFRQVPASPSDGLDALVRHLRVQQLVAVGEALVINCHMMLHYIPEETVGNSTFSQRITFLKALRALEPTLVVVVDEDANFTSGDVVGRIRAAFNYLWIPFEAVDSFLPKDSQQRHRYESAIRWKIENLIAMEGIQRVERLETRGRWVQKMRRLGFRGVGFGEEAAAEVKGVLEEHSAGWGMKKDEERLVLTWKGHDAVFASAWVPS